MGIRNISTFTTVAMLSVACGHTVPMAQVDSHGPDAHAMPAAAVSDTRLPIGSDEFVPRYANVLSNVLKVPAGRIETLPADATYDAIEVAGTLRVDPAMDTTLRVTHLQVLAGGRIDWSVPCGRHLEVILNDVAIDTTVDPFQWGNGILNFGKFRMIGCERSRSFTTAATDIPSGATSIALDAVPAGWSVGDELIIPDTRQQEPYEYRVRKNVAYRESKVTIAAIEGNTITLSKALDYEHKVIRDFDGNVVLKPRVANITRNIVVRSENANGTPGHFANIGHLATWDIRYAAFRDLGRTKSIPLDQTSVDRSHIGTNQPGRYAVHFHHAQGYQSKLIGNAVIGHPAGAKWGVVIHQTSDAVVQQNVVIDFPGSGIVTEDGPEVRNVIRQNFVAYVYGGPEGVAWVINSPEHNNSRSCFGCEGAGYWFKGMEGTIFEGNEAWNTRFGEVFMDAPVADRYPGNPGGPLDSVLPRRAHWFASHADNVTAANLSAGLDLWRTTKTGLINRHISANNWQFQVFFGSVPITDSGSYLKDSTIMCRGNGTEGLFFPRPYSTTLKLENTSVLGCSVGLSQGGGRDLVSIDGGTWQNEIDFNLPTNTIPYGTFWIRGVTNKPYPTELKRATAPLPPEANGMHVLTYGDKNPWLPGTPSSDLTGCSQGIVNWQGTGKNYCLRTNAEVVSR
jgi:hypothetical protein